MSESEAVALLEELLKNPTEFNERGRAYALLQEYFAGFPVETLRPLLRSEDGSIQRSAAFIVSELGVKGEALIAELPPLLVASDVHVVWYAMESLAVCSKGANAEKFGDVILMMESPREPIRRLAMRLMTRVQEEQLDAARRLFERQDARSLHAEMLRVVLEREPAEACIASMINDPDPITRRYGAIAAKRNSLRFPGLIAAMRSSGDEDVRDLLL